jgi:capsular exopolysaccharide synthesis family protein
MTNESQLARAAGLPTNGHDHNSGYNPPFAQHAARPMGLKKVHRLLRGRYPLVIILGILCGLGGAILGYTSQKPMFQSEARLQINPSIPNPRGPDEPMPTLNIFLQEQVEFIESREMISRAMQQPAWKTVNPIISDDAITRFSNNLEVENVPGSLIRIGFSDSDARTALAGATAMWESYKEFFEARDQLGLITKEQHYKTQIGELTAERDTNRNSLNTISPDMGPESLLAYQNEEVRALGQLNNEKLDADLQLAEATEAAKRAGVSIDPGKQPAAVAASNLTAEQIEAMGDQRIVPILTRKRDIERALKSVLLNGFGPKNPQYIRSQNDLDLANQELNAYVDTFNLNYHPLPGVPTPNRNAPGRPSPQLTAVDLQAELAAKTTRVTQLQTKIDEQQRSISALSGKIRLVEDIKRKIDDEESQLTDMRRILSSLDTQQKLMQSQMTIVSMPSLAATPQSDNRRKVAVIGFLLGFLLPACIVLLIGLLDGRFRYSDEANSEMSDVPLLGILPNLPDLLSDPEQAATAAHCVHQIRTILQINGGEEDRRAFAITSGSPGDGKTSLALALGLSFAASGSKTLLIDCDLVGCGLTARLNVTQEHGVLEAMAARDVLAYVRDTDVKDLSILPVGQMMGGYTGTIAPAAVRRLVNDAKKHFEVVVIDTGPILGSIEASPVAVAADGVVLCVSRGQQRQLVERAVAHLKSIGAKIAGVVFNRAQTHDFERSVSRMSMKQLPGTSVNGGNKGRANGERIGPVAKAVASSVRPGSGNGNGNGNHA